jgi:hypothetical protein
MSQYKIFIRNFAVLSFLAASGCTYETINEEVEFTDAGESDAMIRASEMNAGSGANGANKIRATVTNMVMGNSNAKSALNYGLDQAAQTTVQIGIEQTTAGAKNNGPPNLRATILWQTNGVSVKRVVSVGNGTSVTGSAESVAVSLQDLSTGVIDPDDADYKVTVSAVPGSRGSTATPPTLIPLIGEAVYDPPQSLELPAFPGSYSQTPGGTVIIAIPPNVGVQSVYVTPGEFNDSALNYTPDNLYVAQVDAAGTIIKTYFANTSYGFIPVSPQANSIALLVKGNAESPIPGTSDFTPGSDSVTGTDTHYTTDLEVGWFVRANNDLDTSFIEIFEIVDDTHLVLAGNYVGTGGATAELVYTENYSAILRATVTFGIDG